MRRSILISTASLVMVFSNCIEATSSLPNRLDVRQVGDDPAGCLPANYTHAIELDRAFVVEESHKENQSPSRWTMERMPGAKPHVLQPGECVVFHGTLSGYQQAGELTWQEGESYVFVLERVDDSKIKGRLNYVGAFCVMRTPDHRLLFLPYVDHPDGTTTYPPCGRRIGGPPASDGITPPAFH
jgi:hypothetical protein